MPYVQIDTRSEVPVYAQVMDQIRGMVRDGTLEPGTPLPSVRQLATDLEINPNTVARAYDLLEREQILQTVRRRGTFVAARAHEHATRALNQRLDEAVDRVLEQTASLGIDARQLLDALRRRLGDAAARRRSGGESS